MLHTAFFNLIFFTKYSTMKEHAADKPKHMPNSGAKQQKKNDKTKSIIKIKKRTLNFNMS